MTEEELLKIKEHIEIHSRKEPPARKITEILWKAVGELKHISEIKEQLEAAKQERTEALYRNDKLIDETKKFKADYKELCNLKNMRIAELKNEKCELLGIIQGKDEAIKTLTQNLEDTEIINKTLEKRINRAKECMKKLLFIINSDPANYNCKGLVQDAEDFIHNKKCSIRQHGEHCITEERCIMCDK